MRKALSRRAFSLLETTISLGSAAILTISLGASLVVASRGLELGSAPEGKRVDAARLAREVAQNFQQATRFNEQTATTAAFVVPDRDADGDPETIRYAWSGGAGAPLTYSLNGGTAVNLAPSVQTLNLTYNNRSMTAPAAPTESIAAGTKLLFITGGTQVQTSGAAASQRVATAPILLANPSALDRAKIELFESWGYDVTFILPQEPSSNLNALVDQSQVVFVSAEADSSQLNSSIYNSTKGIVIERTIQYDEAHFATGSTSISASALRVKSPNHYIFSGYSNNQTVSVLTSAGEMNYFSGVGSQVTNLMSPTSNGSNAMMCLSPGDRMSNGSDAAGRRVLIPWGFSGFNYNNLTTDGRTILRRAIEWGAGAGTDPNSPNQTFGNTSVYMSLLTPGASKTVATKVNLSQAGTLKSISVYFGGPGAIVRYGIYSNHASNRPDTLRAQTSFSFTSTSANRWLTLSVPDTSLAAGDYWLAFSSSLSTQTLNMTPGGEFSSLNYDSSLLGYRNSHGAPDSQEQLSFSIYATYEPN